RHQPGLGQKLEMARNARLRLAQDGGEIRDGELGLEQQREDAQPRLLTGRLERRVEVVEADWVECLHRWDFSQNLGRNVPPYTSYKDIFILLKDPPQAGSRPSAKAIGTPSSIV